MAAVLSAHERRRGLRHPAAHFGLATAAVLRPGVAVSVVDLSASGALVESAAPVRPDARTELGLDGLDGRRHALRGRVLRCWVAALSPLTYRSALRFDHTFHTG